MNKKTYIIPSTSIVTMLASRMMATSNLEKGDGDFDPANMTYTKQNTNDWGDIWSK